jgi:hypothetical protein
MNYVRFIPKILLNLLNLFLALLLCICDNYYYYKFWLKNILLFKFILVVEVEYEFLENENG